MKKFAAFLVVLSVGLFTLGCGDSAPAKKEPPKGGAAAPAAPGPAAPATPAPDTKK